MLTREQMARLELEIEAMKLERAALRRHLQTHIDFYRYVRDVDRFMKSVRRTIRRL